MIERIFLDEQNLATFKCPKCAKSWKKDLSGFTDRNKRIQLKCKCPCGNTFPVVEERRRDYRKDITVTGAYFDNKKEIRGLITVKNISKSGVGLELSTVQPFRIGDKLQLKFNLDNYQKSFVDKEGIIKKIAGSYLGIQFVDETWEEGLKDYFSDK